MYVCMYVCVNVPHTVIKRPLLLLLTVQISFYLFVRFPLPLHSE